MTAAHGQLLAAAPSGAAVLRGSTSSLRLTAMTRQQLGVGTYIFCRNYQLGSLIQERGDVRTTVFSA